ncbi:uncharacterized protein BDZ99DRAFT_571354 [Mytilinidion resinicola]|uniref:Uncharacterized protein n=1 Tax=Mytilinidion resinicola TaxID=574789 RepID=A0A6A6YLZ7_9PEZI|nr:uncharacterized protein BDZ99DRAFT_571354 [Mytilinidion resinicola]KAF2809558.1 hypothetical protein BDZ99DRAFT_571354 [Mytilinidion resinicola]
MANLRRAPAALPRTEPKTHAAYPKKQKQVVSTTAMFKRPLRPRQNAISSAPTRTPKPIRIIKSAQNPPGPSILKKARIVGESVAAKHPISVAFNETTTTYLDTTTASLTRALNETHAALLAELAAAVSTGPTKPPLSRKTNGASTRYPDTTASASSPQPLATRYAADIAALTAPLGAITLTSTQWTRDMTLHERLTRFHETLQAEAQVVRELQAEYEEVLEELYWVLRAAVGEEEAGRVLEASGVRLGSGGEARGGVAESKLEALEPAPRVEDNEVEGMEREIREVREVALTAFRDEESERRGKEKEQNEKIAESMKRLQGY